MVETSSIVAGESQTAIPRRMIDSEEQHQDSARWKETAIRQMRKKKVGLGHDALQLANSHGLPRQRRDQIVTVDKLIVRFGFSSVIWIDYGLSMIVRLCSM